MKGLALAALGMLLAACQSSTPAKRIADNQAVYQALPAQQQSLVQKGYICEGMSPQAVFLAWGYPNNPPFVGTNNGKRVVRWVYSRHEPVTVVNDWYDPYWGPWHYHYYPGFDTAYIPQKSAVVSFEDEKVVSWEARQGKP